MAISSFAHQYDQRRERDLRLATRAAAQMRHTKFDGRHVLFQEDVDHLMQARADLDRVLTSTPDEPKKPSPQRRPHLMAQPRPITFRQTAGREAWGAFATAAAAAVNPLFGGIVGALSFAGQIRQMGTAALQTQAAPDSAPSPQGRFDLLATGKKPGSKMAAAFTRLTRDAQSMVRPLEGQISALQALAMTPKMDIFVPGMVNTNHLKDGQIDRMIRDGGMASLDDIGVDVHKLTAPTRFEPKPAQIKALTPQPAFPAPTLG